MTPFHVTFKAILALRSAKPDKPKFTWYMVTGLSEPGDLKDTTPFPAKKITFPWNKAVELKY